MLIGRASFPSGGGPYVVGVVNVSHESPNADSVAFDAATAVRRARWLAAGGARIVGGGARASNYAAPLVSWREERDRLLPVVEALAAEGFVVSVDTWDARVARAAVAAGAELVNDSGGFQRPAMIDVVAESGLPVVVPFLPARDPRALRPLRTDDPVAAILPWLEGALERAARAGVADVILDPGVGYAVRGVSQKERDALQRRIFSDLPRLRALGRPLLVAVFRKASAALTRELLGVTIEGGADFLRAHDPYLVADLLRARPYTSSTRSARSSQS